MLAALDKSTAPAEQFSQLLEEKLFDIARTQASDDDEDVILGRDRRTPSVQAWALTSAASPAELQLWAQAFQVPSFNRWVTTFTISFMPVVRVQCSERRATLTYRYSEPEQVLDGSSVFDRLFESVGLKDPLIFVKSSNLHLAQRSHVRLRAPEGIFLSEVAAIRDQSAGTMSGTVLTPPRSGENFLVRVTPDTAVVYLNTQMRVEQWLLGVYYRPGLTGFGKPGLATLLASFALLLAGAIYQSCAGGLARVAGSGGGSDAAVALLLIVPSVFSTYLARSGEHELRSKLLLLPRMAVGLSGLATLICAVSMVVTSGPGEGLELTWYIAATYCALAAAGLFSLHIRTRLQFKKVVRFASRTRLGELA